jgi:hypothetical protein
MRETKGRNAAQVEEVEQYAGEHKSCRSFSRLL